MALVRSTTRPMTCAASSSSIAGGRRRRSGHSAIPCRRSSSRSESAAYVRYGARMSSSNAAFAETRAPVTPGRDGARVCQSADPGHRRFLQRESRRVTRRFRASGSQSDAADGQDGQQTTGHAVHTERPNARPGAPVTPTRGCTGVCHRADPGCSRTSLNARLPRRGSQHHDAV